MSETIVRPTPWAPPPEGFHFEAYAEEDWVTPPIGAGRCRFGRPSCKRPAVASLMRGYSKPVPWDYCEEHLYGGWLEDGKVHRWRLVSDAPKEETNG